MENNKCLKFFLLEKPKYEFKNYKKDFNFNKRILIVNKKSNFTLIPMTLGYKYLIDKDFNKFNY